MDYGTDFLLQGDDIIFTADGDVELVSGPRCIAQDISETLKLTVGTLYWSRETGASLLLMMNDAGSNPDSVIAELERIAIADKRVDPESVAAIQISSGQFRLTFTPMGAIKPETLDYDLTQNIGGEA